MGGRVTSSGAGVVSGDFAKLEAWRRKLRASPKVAEAVGKTVAEEFINLIKDGFRAEANPYGYGWKPKLRNDGKTLSGKTSRLKTGWHVSRVSKLTFVISPSVNYAKFHQHGTRFLPIRMMVPTRARGLPAKYWKAAKAATLEAMEAHFKRG